MARGTEQGTRVLVIEDNSAVRMMLEELLADAGHEVLPFDHLPDTDEVGRLQPDLVLLDVVIGGDRCGLRYLRRLREVPTLRRTPVIVCSGDGPVVEELASMHPPLATAVMRKPVDLATFLDTVGSVLREGHPLAEGKNAHGRAPGNRRLGSSHPGRGGARRRDAARSPEIRAWLLRRAGALHGDGAQEP